MTSNRRKLIEVAIPLDAINAAAAHEKSIRHGHPSTLHLWWARRPLAACRAVLFAQIVDDPSSHPEKFPTKEAVEKERKRLFAIIEDLVQWKNSTNEQVLADARAEIRKSCGDELPPVYDPFSGGCSIPLEAQRLGLPATGSDLNPVAVMIGKATIEIPSRFKDRAPVHPGAKKQTHYHHAAGLAEDVKYYGEWTREQALQHIGHLYPQTDLPKKYGGGKATVIAWIWSRTVPSPDPAFAGVHVPIASSFLLSSKAGREVWIEPNVDIANKKITYRIRNGGTKHEIAVAKSGTKVSHGAHFRCLLSNSAITPEYVKSKGTSGEIGHALITIVAEGKGRRIYVEPSTMHERVAKLAKPKWRPENELVGKCRDQLPHYGMHKFADIFTNRQLVALTTFSDLLHDARHQIEHDAMAAGRSADATPLRNGGKGAVAYAEAVSVYLAFALSRLADRGSTVCTWDSSPKMEALRNTFARQALQMTWDYAECNPFSKASGNFSNNVEWVRKTILKFMPGADGQYKQYQFDAQTVRYPENGIISTDPPYYDNIVYADLSDFFFCWMRSAIRPLYPDLFGVLATPKSEELVAIPYRHGGKNAAETFFLNGMSTAIANMSKQSNNSYPATIYYAFKQNEVKRDGISSTGWATFLQAVLSAGYSVVGTWPMRTEMANRLIASGTNALANSVVLVCRKRDLNADVIGRAEFISPDYS